jgi:urease accessory protein UreF
MSAWLTWQIVDSAFPTGAFAHSWGLDRRGSTADRQHPAALRRFLDESVRKPATGAAARERGLRRSG